MKVERAITKLEKYGWTVKENTNYPQYTAEKTGEDVISFDTQGGQICGIKVRPKEDYNEPTSDYFSGEAVDNIDKALKIAR